MFERKPGLGFGGEPSRRAKGGQGREDMRREKTQGGET